MTRDSKITELFPANFLAACDAIWSDEANKRLMGAIQSLDSVTRRSERRAMNYMVHDLKINPFLTEEAIRSVVYAAPCCSSGANVDLVGFDSTSGKWILVEAKPQVDSATLKKQPPDEKFGHTFEQLSQFLESAGLNAPSLGRAIMTSSEGVKISGRSSWSVKDGVLCRSGIPHRVGQVTIEVIDI